MRLFELFIAEKISLTHLKNPLKKEINSEILDSLHQIYYKESKLDPGARELATKQVSLSYIIPQVSEWLREQLSVRLSGGIENILKTVTGRDVTVKFSKMKVGGTASGRTINLSDRLLDDMTEKLAAMMYDSTLDRVESEDQIVSTMFRTYKAADSYMTDGIDRLVDELISIIIHEMVHIVQHDAQYKAGKWDSTEYRSYLSKDNEKFYGAVRRLTAGEHTAADYKLYRGSPQEIAAFAQQAALKYINDSGIDDIPSSKDIAQFRKELPDSLHWYVESLFNDPANKAEYNVFKRFHKLLYQEVVRYIDRVEKKLKKEERQSTD